MTDVSKRACSVPGCRRWSRRFNNEWICGDHWRLVDRSLKAFRTKRLKLISRLVEKHEAELAVLQARLVPGGPDDPNVWVAADRACQTRKRWRRLERATWAKMKRQAIFKAAGL